jgi:hypothetical protein
MKLRPFSTVPLRTALLLARQRNAFNQRNIEVIDRKFAPWASAAADVSRASLGSTIHPYPGLGHQLAGWISGHLWAHDLGIRYTGGTISRDQDGLFNFATEVAQPVERRAKRIRLLSVPDERDPRSIAVLRGQVNRALMLAKGRPVHFELALDQPRWDQTPAAAAISAAVLGGAQGTILERIKATKPPYIAIHVRRGDVDPAMMGGTTGQSRWIDEEWYIALLRRLKRNPQLAGLEVRLYALGEPEHFPLLSREGVTLCLNRDRDLDFVELCAARVLVVAPSSFSFTAGLASSGAVIARYPWWHHIPDSGAWVRADSDGNFSMPALERAVAHQN